jgi:hypothetical protein
MPKEISAFGLEGLKGYAASDRQLLHSPLRCSQWNGAWNHPAGDFPLRVTHAQHLDPHGCQTGIVESKLFGNWLCYVQSPPCHKRAAIIQADDGRSAISQVGYPDAARQRQCLVRSTPARWPEILAQCGRSREKQPSFPIVRSHTLLDVSRRLSRRHRRVANSVHRIRSVTITRIISLPASHQDTRRQQNKDPARHLHDFPGPAPKKQQRDRRNKSQDSIFWHRLARLKSLRGGTLPVDFERLLPSIHVVQSTVSNSILKGRKRVLGMAGGLLSA